MIFLTLLIIPTIVAFVSFLAFGKRVTLKEFALQMGIQIVIIGALTAILRCMNTSDTEIQNGVVSNKARQEVSCSHSYRCMCYTTCDSDNHCTEHCQTCYDHSYDVDWNVFTTNQETIQIDRINRQGTDQPPRWTAVKVGEPTSRSYSFENYIKAAPDTLFRHQGLVAKYAAHLPNYPIDIYDYYRNNHIVAVGFSPKDVGLWNLKLAELNGALGVQKQVNAVLVLVKGQPQEYFEALNQHWLGGKKNDVVVVVGVVDSSDTLKASWVQVMSWTDREILKVVLRDHILDLPILAPETVIPVIQEDVQKLFIRRNWKDFKYLMSSATPTKGQWIFALIFGFLVSIGVSWLLAENDVFNEERRGPYGNY